jgi:hypothetical protein
LSDKSIIRRFLGFDHRQHIPALAVQAVIRDPVPRLSVVAIHRDFDPDLGMVTNTTFSSCEWRPEFIEGSINSLRVRFSESLRGIVLLWTKLSGTLD